MAHGRRLIVGALAGLVAGGAALGAGPCEEERGRTGLGLAAREGGLAVAVIDDDSAAGAGGLHVDDAVVQVNGTLPRSCADWARAVREARKDGKALLVLVRRGEHEVPLVLAAAVWQRTVVVAPAPPPVEAPSVKALVATPPPPPLPAAVHVSVEQVRGGLAALAPAGASPRQLSAYRASLLKLHREIETLAARRAAPPPVVDGLRTVLRYYDAAEVAWAVEEAAREQERRPRHVPTPEAATAPFFTDSEPAATIDEFPFLRATVSRDPSPTVVGEASGLWRPVQARALLWEHGREELARLSGWLGDAPR